MKHQSIIVFCPRAGLSPQIQHSPLYPLLSLPFRICIRSICHNIVYHLISSSTATRLPIYHSFYSRGGQTTTCGPYPAVQCLFCGPFQLNDFIVNFLVWRLVTRLNCLARFKYERSYTDVIPSKRKANIRQSLYILVQKRIVKICGSLLMVQVHPSANF